MARSSSPPICDLDTVLPPALAAGERIAMGDGVAVSFSQRPPGLIGPFRTRAVQIWISDTGADWEARCRGSEPVAPGGPAVAVVPAGSVFDSTWRTAGALLVVRLSPKLASDLAGGPVARFDAAPVGRLEVRDALIAGLVLTLRTEMADTAAADARLAALALCLASRVLALPLATDARPEKPLRILSEKSLARIEARVKARIRERVTTDELAREIGLGAGRFRALFKATLNLTPEQYVLRQRLLHARAAIETGNQTIGEVAHAFGFSDHSHLTTQFRKLFGVAPRSLLPRVREQ